MPPPRKRLEADILEDWIEKQKEQKRAPRPLKGRMPRVTPMQSPRQRRALRQTGDPIRAAYGKEHQANATPTRPDVKGLTREVGPLDKYNDKDHRTGKATDARYPKRMKTARKPRTTQPQVSAWKPSIADFSGSLEAFIAAEGKI